MSWLTIVGIAFGLAMDALAVSIATGLHLKELTPRQIFRMSFHFGLFQCLMPIVGWLAGLTVADVISAVDHWVAFGLLVLIGGKMIVDSRSEQAGPATDPTRGMMLVTLSVATSIDALAVGLSFALLGVSVWIPAIIIGVVTAILSMLGMLFGARLGRRWGIWAARLGGLVLVGIGIKIVIEG